MTKRELIELLKDVDDDAEVFSWQENEFNDTFYSVCSINCNLAPLSDWLDKDGNPVKPRQLGTFK